MTDGRPLEIKVLLLCGRATFKKSWGNLIICSTYQSWSWQSNYHKLSLPLLLSRTKKLSHPQVEVVFHLETFPQVLPFDRTNLHCLRLLYLDLFQQDYCPQLWSSMHDLAWKPTDLKLARSIFEWRQFRWIRNVFVGMKTVLNWVQTFQLYKYFYYAIISPWRFRKTICGKFTKQWSTNCSQLQNICQA